MTVLETPGFLRDAAAAMTDQERIAAIHFLAANPDAGDLMPDTGGGRKGAGTRQARRCANYLLLPQRLAAPVPSQRVREERKYRFDKGRAERDEGPFEKHAQNGARRETVSAPLEACAAPFALLPRLVAGYRKRMVL